MKRQIMLLSACTVALLSACSSNTRIANEVYAPAAKNELRAPATPLVTIDPYTSAWSFADRLNEESVRHWTGRNFPLLGSLRVDGQSQRIACCLTRFDCNTFLLRCQDRERHKTTKSPFALCGAFDGQCIRYAPLCPLLIAIIAPFQSIMQKNLHFLSFSPKYC